MSEPLTVAKTESVPAGRRVRHFDELDDESQRLIVDVASGDTRRDGAPALDRGDVVVFTDYYEVVGR